MNTARHALEALEAAEKAVQALYAARAVLAAVAADDDGLSVLTQPAMALSRVIERHTKSLETDIGAWASYLRDAAEPHLSPGYRYQRTQRANQATTIGDLFQPGPDGMVSGPSRPLRAGETVTGGMPTTGPCLASVAGQPDLRCILRQGHTTEHVCGYTRWSDRVPALEPLCASIGWHIDLDNAGAHPVCQLPRGHDHADQHHANYPVGGGTIHHGWTSDQAAAAVLKLRADDEDDSGFTDETFVDRHGFRHGI